MKYRLFGNTGLRVSELCLGTMTFGEDWGWGSDQKESQKVLECFAEAGGNFIDTANMYTNGNSERFLGEFLKTRRDDFVLATKYTLTQNPNDPNASGNHRKSLVKALNESLQRLATDYIDIFWVHAWDEHTPIEETLRALDDQVRAGKILYIGISDVPAWVLSKANTIAEFKNWTAFAGLQVEYSLIERTIEYDLLPAARHLGMAVTTWGPLAGGILTGKYNKGSKTQETSGRHTEGPWADAYKTDNNLRIAQAVLDVSEKINRPPSQVALNWIRGQQRGNIIPIIGAKKLSQLQDNLKCLDWELDQESLDFLNEETKLAPVFPHSFLSFEQVRGMIHGEKADLIIGR